MNKIFLIGRLTKDPEIKVLDDSGKVMSKLFLAVERKFKNANGEKQTDFIPVVFFGKPAEIVGEYMKKGRLISVSGWLQTSTYEANDGTRRYRAEVVGDEFQFIDGKKEAI